MGKLFLRAFFEKERAHQIVLLNDSAVSPDEIPLLLEFDSLHGRWNTPYSFDGETLDIRDSRLRVTTRNRIEHLPLRESGAKLAVDCTGSFKSVPALDPYFAGGIEKAVVSAPIKESGALNLVYGINHELYSPRKHRIVTAASCTTNCIAPVVKVIHEELGIIHGSVTTIHDATNTQNIVDRPTGSPRRARSALNSMIPTTTGSATAITLIYPELAGKLDGHAVRVPVLNASLADCVFEVSRPTRKIEVNIKFREWSEGSLRGILGFEDRPLVSADFVNDPRSAIIDADSTMVTNGTQVKVFAWYDNEWAYAMRLVDIALMVADSIK